MTGIEMIVQERQEQIEKHGYTIESDCVHNKKQQLRKAALRLLIDSPEREWLVPTGWSAERWAYMANKPLIERLAIAGAWLGAEIDRLKRVKEVEGE